jgi:hypothetical protein
MMIRHVPQPKLIIWYVGLAVAYVLLPTLAQAQVRISEVAWMGTTQSSDDEWIELHNTTGDAVTLDGWVLGDGQSLSISLSGSIGGNAYVLLERTDDTAVPDVSMLMAYTGALANTGRTLTLRDQSGARIDEVVGGENWSLIGGDNATKMTAQRTSAGDWITQVGTPGAATVPGAVSPVATSSLQSAAGTSQSNTRRTGSSRVLHRTPPVKKEPAALTVTIDAPSVAYVNLPVTFTAVPEGPSSAILKSLKYTWNLGDTHTASSSVVTHRYEYPGEYTVVVEAQFAKRYEYVRHEIHVLPIALTLSRGDRGELRITNTSSHEVDIGGYTIRGATSFVFPRFTILKPQGVLTLSPSRVGGTIMPVTLLDHGMFVVATMEATQEMARASTSGPAPAPLSLETNTSRTTESPVASTETAPQIIRIGEDRAPEEAGRIQQFFARILNFF